MCFISIQITMKMDGFHQVITVERFMSMQGDGQVLIYSRRYPKYSRLTLPWIPVRLRALFTLLCVGGRIRSEGCLAFGLAAEYLLSPTISGGEAAIVPFARLKKRSKMSRLRG